MSSHYKLKATIEGVEVVGESLELTGNKAFKVFPVEKNNTKAPIRGSAVVSILGKNHSISLNHKVNDSPDPEPSSTKYSYIMNMYVSGTTPVAAADKENQDTAYVMASRGKTTYDSTGHSTQKIIISDAYTTQAAVRAAVGDFSSYTGGMEYNKGSVMTLITFVMYYKFAEESGGVVVPPPVPDEDTPASHRKRIPCRPSAAVNDWIVNGSVGYIVEFKTTESGAWQRRFFNAWDAFIAFWDSIYTNTTDYYDMVFYYIYQGTVQFNELLNERTGPITITEIDNGKGVGIHGAKNLYLVPAQQSGKTTYGAAMISATSGMLDTGYGMWFFDDLTITQIANNRLTAPAKGTYNLRPKFRIQSANKAFNIATVTSSLISNPDGAGTLSYQYVGQPFILKIYKETANGITKDYLRPYYKQEGTSQSTSLWKSDINLMGSQNFNPLKYDGSVDGVHALHTRDIGCRGFLSGPMSGNYGLCIFQLIPMSLYPMFGLNPYTVNDDLDGEGGVGTKGINYVNRYTRYESAIGSAGNDDKYKAAFLKWPNEDGNNDPDHISPGIIESLLSKMGKNWEHSYQNDSNYTIVDRVMLVPVLWTETRLEDDATFRTKLINNDLGFGYYFLSPNAKDSEIDNPAVDAIYRIHIDGLDIQIQ